MMEAREGDALIATPSLTGGAGRTSLTAVVMARVTDVVAQGAARGAVFVPVTTTIIL